MSNKDENNIKNNQNYPRKLPSSRLAIFQNSNNQNSNNIRTNNNTNNYSSSNNFKDILNKFETKKHESSINLIEKEEKSKIVPGSELMSDENPDMKLYKYAKIKSLKNNS